MSKLSDASAKAAEVPASGSRITYDDTLRGFGLRITAGGARAWILNYRFRGQERRYTIGRCSDWTAAQARERVKELRRDIDRGVDPLADRIADRDAITVAKLAEAFQTEHVSKLRPDTQREYRAMLQRICKEFGRKKAAELSRAQVKQLHSSVAKKTPFLANRLLAVLSSLYNFGIGEELIKVNPCKGIEREEEKGRERSLSDDEIARLFAALDAHSERIGVNAIRLLLLTGARKGETLAAEWSHFDLAAGVWNKSAETIKTKRSHRVPLNGPALELLRRMRAEADADEARRTRWVFPSVGGKHLEDVKRLWHDVCEAAGLTDARVHDLRHSYASILVSSGLSLPIIGKLLGHSQSRTTERYAHLADDALRAATERAGSAIAKAGNVVPLKRAG